MALHLKMQYLSLIENFCHLEFEIKFFSGYAEGIVGDIASNNELLNHIMGHDSSIGRIAQRVKDD